MQKGENMKKIISLSLLLVMMFSAFVGTFSFVSAQDSEPELKVAYANIELANAVYVYIAVDYSDFESSDGIKLKVTNTVSGKSAMLSPKKDITAPAGCVAFRYSSIGTTNMGDELVLQPYRNGEPCGESKTYSILEYALKAHERGEKLFIELVEAMIQYGASQQKISGNYGTYNLAEKWSLVVASGATVRKKIVKRDSELALTPKDESRAALYTSSLDRVENNTLVASAEYQSYIFLSESVLTDFYFNFNCYDGETDTVSATFSESVASVEKSYYSTLGGVYTDASELTNPTVLKVSSGALTEETPNGGSLTLEKGSLKILAGKDSGFDMVAALPESISSESTMTLTVSIKAIEGAAMANGPMIRTESGDFAIYTATSEYIYLGNEKVAISGYYTACYLTLHIVLDTEADTMTAYDASGRLLGVTELSLGGGTAINSLVWFVGAEEGVEIGKYILTKGSIFG